MGVTFCPTLACTIPPTPETPSTLTSYSDACWGSQIGGAISNGTLLPLFKFRSMSGGIVFRTGGPLGWLGEHQDRTALRSCEAEIRATNATSKKVDDFCNLCTSMCTSGHRLPDATQLTLLYNDNNACVQWSHNMTSKAARHIKLCENSVREWVQDKLSPSGMSLAKSTLRIYLPKKCVMVPTSDVYGTLSCLVYLTFIKPLFWQFIMDDNCFQQL